MCIYISLSLYIYIYIYILLLLLIIIITIILMMMIMIIMISPWRTYDGTLEGHVAHFAQGTACSAHRVESI